MILQNLSSLFLLDEKKLYVSPSRQLFALKRRRKKATIQFCILRLEFCIESFMPLVKCPACGKETEYSQSNEFRPFCSERCKLIDFGAWADGEGLVEHRHRTTG